MISLWSFCLLMLNLLLVPRLIACLRTSTPTSYSVGWIWVAYDRITYAELHTLGIQSIFQGLKCCDFVVFITFSRARQRFTIWRKIARRRFSLRGIFGFLAGKWVCFGRKHWLILIPREYTSVAVANLVVFRQCFLLTNSFRCVREKESNNKKRKNEQPNRSFTPYISHSKIFSRGESSQ